MILVLGGTLEGREIAGALAGEGHEVLVTVVSGYGAVMIPPDLAVEVLVKQLDAEEITDIITCRGIRLIIDATHPYARKITDTAWNTARLNDIPYIRYERPPVTAGKEDDMIYRAGSYEEAADLATGLGKTVFLAIGSRNLGPFVSPGREAGSRIVARVLPDAQVMEQCAAAGINPKDIIAVQGPFSLEMNMAMFREYGAEVLVTKDSGTTGGTDAKLEAAARMGIPVVIVTRPEYKGIPVTDRLEDILRMARQI